MVTFDPAKNRKSIADHGVALSEAERFDWENCAIVEDRSEEYGERREQATGFIGLDVCVYIYTMRGDEERAIGLRKATRQESSQPCQGAVKMRMTRKEAAARALASAEAMTDEEDARLTAAALADPDNPPLTEEQMARMVPAHLVKSRGGRPRLPVHKLQITARLDPDVLDFLRSGGPGWQTRMNNILRRAMKRTKAGR